jgi:hypothetical protein
MRTLVKATRPALIGAFEPTVLNGRIKMDYKFTYGKFFNVFFHLGVAVNVLLVIWIFLYFFEVI